MHKPVDDLKIHSISHLVGNTPLLAIEFYYNNEPRTIYAKAENMNMTGSIKDRMAIHIIKKAYSRGAIHEGSTIIEATSGNTGISFSALGRALGHQVIIFMPDWM
ncbi:MAG TPA: pyridoxal-phosphate dependent enzyme, partial [Ignavibacteria bacterium]